MEATKDCRSLWYLNNICALVVQDPIAIQKWIIVKDQLVYNAADKQRIHDLITRSSYEEAIRATLDCWVATATQNVSPDAQVRLLAELLRSQSLNTLAEKIETLQPGIPLAAATSRGLWLGMEANVHNYTGRELQIQKLRRLVLQGGPSTLTGVVGLGGVGKTTLVRKYVHEYRRDGENVLWIHADSIASIRTSFTAAAKLLGVFTHNQLSNTELVHLVYNALGDRPSLFVFDNVDSWRELKQFQPTQLHPDTKHPYIIVTSRRRDVIPHRKQILHLDVFTMVEAVDFIVEELPILINRRADAESLAETLQRLPLALQQAVAYIQTNIIEDQACVTKYLKHFEDQADKLLAFGDPESRSSGEKVRTALTTWLVTLEQIQKTELGGQAIRIMQFLSFLNPNGIRIDFIRTVLGTDDGHLPEETTDACLKLLERYSMLRIEYRAEASLGGPPATVVTLHRLVQQVIRLNANAETHDRICKAVIHAVQDSFVGHMFSDRIRECMIQGIYNFSFLVTQTELLNPSIEYLSRLTWYAYSYGYMDNALDIAGKTLHILDSLPDQNHENVLEMKLRQVEVKFRQEHFEEAREMLLESISKAKQVLEEGSLILLRNYSMLAAIYSRLNQDDKAVEILDRILPLQRAKLGELHLQTHISTHRLGIALYKVGRLDEALNIFKILYGRNLEKYGAVHTETLNAQSWIAEILFAQGDLNSAMDLFNEVLHGRMELFRDEKHKQVKYCHKWIQKIEDARARV